MLPCLQVQSKRGPLVDGIVEFRQRTKLPSDRSLPKFNKGADPSFVSSFVHHQRSSWIDETAKSVVRFTLLSRIILKQPRWKQAPDSITTNFSP